MTLDDTENEMQPTTSALDLKGLFDAPSKNIKLAFEHVIELITQQSREIDNLKQAQLDATKANEKLRSQIERYADELAKERTGTAAELQKLRKDCHDLLTLHQQSEATVGILQQEIKNLQFYIHGTSHTVQNITDDRGRLDSFVFVPDPRGETQLSFDLETDLVDQSLSRIKSRHSVTSIHVADDTEVHSVASSQSECEELPASPENDRRDEYPGTSSEQIIIPSSSIVGSSSDTEEPVGNDDIVSSKPVNEISSCVSDGELVRNTSIPISHEVKPTDNETDHCLEKEEETAVNIPADDIPANDNPISERNSSPSRRDLADFATANSQANNKSVPSSIARIVSTESQAKKNALYSVLSAKRLAGDQTVTARLHRLESSLSEVLKSLRDIDTNTNRDGNDQVEKMVSNIMKRLGNVEHFLHGFNEEHENEQTQAERLAIGEEHDDSTRHVVEKNHDGNNQEVDYESTVSKDWSLVNPAKTDLEKVPSLLCHLEKRESKTKAALGDLSKQISDLQSEFNSRDTIEEPTNRLSPEAESEIFKISDGLHRQISDIVTSIEGKVSNEDFIRETSSIRHALERCQCESVDTKQDEAGEEVNRGVNLKMLELSKQIANLDESKMSKDEFDLRMEQSDASLRSLVEDRITRHSVEMANKTETMASELKDIRSLVDSQVTVSRPPSEPSNRIDVDRGTDLDEMIQQATESVRVSLEESFTKRLDELKCIEDELDGLVSQLAEKPSQDQIDSMIENLESNMSQRIGEDKDLQLIIAQMKKELSQRMTRSEVVHLVKTVINQAKLGIQNTKDSLMIGRTPYRCIGCNQSFPAGVNGIRAPKVNHDSLPIQGSFSIAPVLHSASRKSLRSLQTRRSVPVRPSTAVIGGGLSSRYSFQARNNSR